eukprot:14797596-Ditylum_brightwellii.AAC.1
MFRSIAALAMLCCVVVSKFNLPNVVANTQPSNMFMMHFFLDDTTSERDAAAVGGNLAGII